MNESLFVPEQFKPPNNTRVGKYFLRPLTEKYTRIDCEAVNASQEVIRMTRGGSWPRETISYDDDFTDLAEHRRMIEAREAFAFAIVDGDETTCFGSVYVYPPNHPFDDSDKTAMPQDADAVISFWTSKQAYETGFYPKLYKFVVSWLRTEWPFKEPYIANKMKLSEGV